MQAICRQPQRAPVCAPLHCERHRPEQSTLYRLVQQHTAGLIAHTEASTGAELPQFVEDEFDAFLERNILAQRPGAERARRGRTEAARAAQAVTNTSLRAATPNRSRGGVAPRASAAPSESESTLRTWSPTNLVNVQWHDKPALWGLTVAKSRHLRAPKAAPGPSSVVPEGVWNCYACCALPCSLCVTSGFGRLRLGLAAAADTQAEQRNADQ